MHREVINPPELPTVNPTYSQAIKANGMIFVAGQIGIDPATGKLISSDIAEQELRGKVGDGVSQAADFISAASSIPSLYFTPSMTFGNWF